MMLKNGQLPEFCDCIQLFMKKLSDLLEGKKGKMDDNKMKGFTIELMFAAETDTNEYRINIHSGLHQNYSYTIFNSSKGSYIIQENSLIDSLTNQSVSISPKVKWKLINDWNLNFGDKKILHFRGEFRFFVHPIDYIPKRIDFEDNFLNYIFANYSTIGKNENENNFTIELEWEDVLTNNKNPLRSLFANYRRMYPIWGPETVTLPATTSVSNPTKSGGFIVRTKKQNEKLKKLKIVF